MSIFFFLLQNSSLSHPPFRRSSCLLVLFLVDFQVATQNLIPKTRQTAAEQRATQAKASLAKSAKRQKQKKEIVREMYPLVMVSQPTRKPLLYRMLILSQAKFSEKRLEDAYYYEHRSKKDQHEHLDVCCDPKVPSLWRRSSCQAIQS
jgi:hypothetical protein